MVSTNIVTINDKKYHIKAVSSYQRKIPNENYLFGLQVGIEIKRLSDNKTLQWNEIKGTYLAEKIEDYIYNTINGQRIFY